ncbi:MAG: MFS transporter [Brevibacterium yomogidense]
MARIEDTDGIRVPFAALTAAVSLGVATFFTLYSLIPVTRTDDPGVGSAFVGVLMTCVIAVQVGTPTLVRRFSLRTVVSGSLAALGVGALVAGIAGTGAASGLALVALLAGGALAGAGFGILIVAGSQGVGVLVPGTGLGRALGLYGLITALATALGSPAGVQVGVAFSPTTFGVVAVVLCVLGAVAAFGIPASIGRGDDAPGKTQGAGGTEGNSRSSGDSVSSDASGSSGDSGTTGSGPVTGATGITGSEEPHATTTLGALRMLALTLTFLLLAVLFLSHAITSLPVLASDSVSPALTILLAQLGTAGGRWVGGFAEPRITRSGTIMLATILLVIGSLTGVFTSNGEAIGISAVILGLGVGTAQTVALHTAMRRTDAGRASVVWNLGVDGGLWLGGILAGLVLAQGAMLPAIFAAASILAIVGAVLAVKETGRP